MKNEMEDIDRLIKASLTEEESKFYDELDEQPVFEMIFGLFKSHNRWLIIVMNIIQLAALVFAVYCAIQFFKTDDTQLLIKWGIGGIIGLLMVSMLKIFAWMQMDKNALLRELKRIELQISSLAGKQSS